ncbi:cardiolipin synthase [Limosilactobacillus kribbianus]|uniref:cardiolipin synthase n=1 Tax=Limosilactobacillus kribbianus TaxID=2982695 RepID=UPI002263BEE9|nr:cardiolipin synthase [Limosilactobacillus kribbianus]
MALTWAIVRWILLLIIVLNEVLAIYTVFREKRDIAATWAWLLVLTLIPVLGFILYAFLGRKLPHRRLNLMKTQTQLKLQEAIDRQKQQFINMPKPRHQVTQIYRRTIMLFQNIDDSFLSRHNHVEIFTTGNDLFQRMFDEIAAATKSIHIEFYSIYNDRIGNQLRTLLERKASEGVEVRVLYDSWGSMGVHPSFYDGLREQGGFAEPFLLSRSNLFDFRLNYRDHRKIVVLDGKIGYVGGFNVGDQYLGRFEKFGNWRDTHLRIVGGGVYGLQRRFISDWNASAAKPEEKLEHYRSYFPEIKVRHGSTALQVVTNGPESEMEKIKLGYLRLINAAQDHIWIQTPYLIPDDSVLDALRVAAHSGVDVRIMIPCKPDHPFVYRATQYYAHALAGEGVTIYTYQNGFLHAKTMTVDGRMASVGSANMDIRSFKLNFEINTFIYDAVTTDQLEQIFVNDIRDCRVMTSERFDQQSRWLHFKQRFSRLLSPIL